MTKQTTATKSIEKIFLLKNGKEPEQCEQISNSGSNRQYFRLISNEETYIGTYSENIEENEAFIAMANHFRKYDLNVPKIIIVSDDRKAYIQQDFGNCDLLSHVNENREEVQLHPTTIFLYKKSIQNLAKLQLIGGERFDYDKYCFPVAEFDSTSMMWDLNYFKYYFLRPIFENYHELKLEKDFQKIVALVSDSEFSGFMYRDFQSRNIMIQENKPYFIDFQGGRRGSIIYDIISLLEQVKAAIPEVQKKVLLNYYFDEINKYKIFDREKFNREYEFLLLLRMLQTLGAYGYRGILEKKAHFVESLIPAFKKTKTYILQDSITAQFPYLALLFQKIEMEKIQSLITD